jgi:hypothetical protein
MRLLSWTLSAILWLICQGARANVDAVVIAFGGEEPSYVEELTGLRDPAAIKAAADVNGATLVLDGARAYLVDRSLRGDLVNRALRVALSELSFAESFGVVSAESSPGVLALAQSTMGVVMRLQGLEGSNLTVAPSTTVRLTDGNRFLNLNLEPNFPSEVQARLLLSPIQFASHAQAGSKTNKPFSPFFDVVEGVKLRVFGKLGNNRTQRISDLKFVVDQLYSWDEESRKDAYGAFEKFLLDSERLYPDPGIKDRIGSRLSDLAPEFREMIRAKIEGQYAAQWGVEEVARFIGNARVSSVGKMPLLVAGRRSSDGNFTAIVFGLTPP